METLLPLAALVGASGIFLAASVKKTQGFEDITSNVKSRLPPSRVEHIETTKKKFNAISNIMNVKNPLGNPLLPPNFTNSEFNQVNQDVTQSLQSLKAQPSGNKYILKPYSTADIQLSNPKEGTLFNSISKCQSIKTIDCNAFNDPNFAENCGMCHQGGKDSTNTSVIGGLYVSPDDKTNAKILADRSNTKKIEYAPSVGSCDPKRFTVTKESCELVKKQMECESGRSFGKNCSQCFQDGSFHYIDPEIRKTNASLSFVGSGKLIVKFVTKSANKPITKMLGNNPVNVSLELEEGDEILLNVVLADDTVPDDVPSIAGILTGTTPSGKFSIDIFRLIDIDLETNGKPHVGGIQELNGDSYRRMQPGFEKNKMLLHLKNPFTFLDINDSEVMKCASAPFITKESSAIFLDSSPCYKKGQGPGKYSLECLQNTFETVGCTAKGSSYPKNVADAAKINSSGNSIETISKMISELSNIGYTGNDSSGKSLPISQVNDASIKCTGKKIENPCTLEGNGKHGPNCLAYLWANGGATEQGKNALGPTYTGSQSSLSGKTQQYCTTSGSLAPIDENGKINTAAVQFWNGLNGGTSLNTIKNAMDNIHKAANDNSKTVGKRSVILDQCYGINVKTDYCNDPNSNPFPQSVQNEVYTLVKNGTLKNYDQCVTNPRINQLSQAYAVAGDDAALNKTRMAMCKGYFTKYPYWRGTNPQDDDRCPITSNPPMASVLDNKAGHTQTPFSPPSDPYANVLLKDNSIPNINIPSPVCPPGSQNYIGYGRCHKATFEEARDLCLKLNECTGVTRDNTGYEPRNGTIMSWPGALSWKR